MLKLENRTFDTPDCPKSTERIYEFSSMFRDALFEFTSFFMLLYVQLASPIATSVSYTTMFFVISMVLIGSRILGGLCWSVASHVMENHKFKYGNYRSMTFLGAVMETVSFLMMFFISPLFSGWGYVASFLIFYTIGECVYSFNDIGFWSFMNTTSYNEKKRSRISAIANLLCAFGSYAVASVAPAITAGNPKRNITIFAMVLISIYFITELIFCLMMKERADYHIGSVDETNKKKTSPFSSLKLLKDRNILMVNLALLMFFVAQDCFIANSSNFFYFEYGYGSFGSAPYGNAKLSGGVVSFFFSLVYGVGVVISNYLYIFLQGKFGKKKLCLTDVFVMAAIYILLYFFGFKAGNEIVLFILTFLLALCSGQIYMTVTMNTYNSAEYYRYTYNENRDASCVAIKALGVKSANGIQTGIFYAFLAMSGLLTINQNVASIEASGARGEVSDVITTVNSMVHESDISSNLTLFKSCLTFVPLICIILAVVITCFCVSFTDEKKYAQICEALNSRDEAKK